MGIKGNFPYETRFLPACNRHDVCYRCGIVYSWTRKECDRAFLRDMLQICHDRYSVGSGLINKIKHKVCNGAAKTYYKAVDLFGGIKFESRPSLVHCRQVCGRKWKAKHVKMRTVEYVTLVLNLSKHQILCKDD